MRVKGVQLGAGVIALVLLVLVLSQRGMAAVHRPASPAGFIPTDPDFPIWDGATDEKYADLDYYDVEDEYLVVFDVWDATEEGHDIKAITITAEGSLVFGPFCISCSDDYDDMRPAVERAIANPSYLVVWERGPLGNKDIYGSWITHYGGVGTEFLIAGYLGDQVYPDVAYNSYAFTYLVVWEDHDPTTPEDPPDIIGRCFDFYGTPIGGALGIAENPGGQYRPSVVTDDGSIDLHHWLVVWRDETALTAAIYGRKVSASFAPKSCSLPSSAFPIAIAPDEQGAPAVNSGTMDPWTSEFLVVWPEGFEILARRLDGEDLSLLGDAITVSDYPSAKFNPAVAFDSLSSEWWVVWEDTRDFPMYSLIYGQRILSDGTVRGQSINQRVSKDPDWLPPSTNQQEPAIVYNWTADKALVAWQDYGHYSNWGIWGRIWAPVERVWLPLILKSCP